MARIPMVDKRNNKSDELGPAAKVATSTLKPKEGGGKVVPPKEPVPRKGPPLAFESREHPEDTTTVVVTTTGKLPPAGRGAVIMSSTGDNEVMVDLWCAGCARGLWEMTGPGGKARLLCKNDACTLGQSGEEPFGLDLEQAIARLIELDSSPAPLFGRSPLPSLDPGGWPANAALWLDVDAQVVLDSPTFKAALVEPEPEVIAAEELMPTPEQSARIRAAQQLDPANDPALKQIGPKALGERLHKELEPLIKKIYEAPAVVATERADGVKVWPGLDAAIAAACAVLQSPETHTAGAVGEYLPRNPYRRYGIDLPDKNAPIPMLLWCPVCHTKHIDEGEFAAKAHRSHQCDNCGLIWRPAHVSTIGVKHLPPEK